MVLLVTALVTYMTPRVLMVLVALGVLVVDSDQLLQTLVLLLVDWVVAAAG